MGDESSTEFLSGKSNERKALKEALPDVLEGSGLTRPETTRAFTHALQANLDPDIKDSQVVSGAFEDLFGTARTEEIVAQWPVADYLQGLKEEPSLARIVKDNLQAAPMGRGAKERDRMISLIDRTRSAVDLIEDGLTLGRGGNLTAVHGEMGKIEANLRANQAAREAAIKKDYQPRIERAGDEDTKKIWKEEQAQRLRAVNAQEFIFPSSIDETASPVSQLLGRLEGDSPEDRGLVLKALRGTLDSPNASFLGRSLWSTLLCQQRAEQNTASFRQVQETPLMASVSTELAHLTYDDQEALKKACQERCPSTDEAQAYARGIAQYLDSLTLTGVTRADRDLPMNEAISEALTFANREKVKAAATKPPEKKELSAEEFLTTNQVSLAKDNPRAGEKLAQVLAVEDRRLVAGPNASPEQIRQVLEKGGQVYGLEVIRFGNKETTQLFRVTGVGDGGEYQGQILRAREGDDIEATRRPAAFKGMVVLPPEAVAELEQPEAVPEPPPPPEPAAEPEPPTAEKPLLERDNDPQAEEFLTANQAGLAGRAKERLTQALTTEGRHVIAGSDASPEQVREALTSGSQILGLEISRFGTKRTPQLIEVTGVGKEGRLEGRILRTREGEDAEVTRRPTAFKGMVVLLPEAAAELKESSR
jgi:hypothetical protein